MKNFSFRRFLFGVLILTFSSTSGFLIYKIGNFYDHLDVFSGHIERQDESASRDELVVLQKYVDQNTRFGLLGLSFLGERYLFKDIKCYRSAVYNISRDYVKTEQELSGEEGLCAAFLRGNAVWRRSQGIFRNGLSLPADTPEQKTIKENQLKMADELAATLAKDDYEMALRSNPDHHQSSWNYDLLSNPATRLNALMPRPGKIRARLGNGPSFGSKEPGPQGDDGEDGEGNKSKDIDTEREGPGNPKGRPRKVG